jgi:hypothetical protein
MGTSVSPCLHALAHEPVHEGALGVHEVELVVEAGEHLGVAAQVGFESKVETSSSHFSFKRLITGGFNVSMRVS